jgi:hypothetical protein
MEADLARIKSANDADSFVSTLHKIIDDELTNDYWDITLPNALETSAARSPSLFAYYAALNLLDAKVLFSNLKVSELLDPALRSNKSALERHHLFPRAYLKRQGVTQVKEVNQCANFALVEWGDNIRISDQPPSYYFPQLAERMAVRELQHMMWWHALPDRWYDMEYGAFLAERRKLMAAITRQGFETLQHHD